ncbi:MAG: DNA-binding protein [Hungatella sp.]|nr:DNA-binding protein [Hungatella sp.]
MEYRTFGNHYVLRIDKGEEVLASIEKLCRAEEIRVGSAVGLGACDRVTVGLFDTVNKVYKKNTFTGPMEISSLVGNISTKEGEPYLHFHINVCNEENQILGGHLNECYISATGEITVTKIEGCIEREMSEEIGLNLYKFL